MNLDLQKFTDHMSMHFGDEYWNKLNQYIKDSNAMIAGGAVLAAYSNDIVNDLDVYIYASKAVDFVNNLTNDGTYEVKIPTPGRPNDGSGIQLNTVTVTTSQSSYNEGQSFAIVFTTSQPIQNQPLVINLTLVNGNFLTNDYSGGLSVTIPVGSSTTQTMIQITDDTTDEGDEELLIDIQNVPSGYVINNDNIIIRIYDNDYSVQAFGTPLHPTFGLVTPIIPTGYYAALEGL